MYLTASFNYKLTANKNKTVKYQSARYTRTIEWE